MALNRIRPRALDSRPSRAGWALLLLLSASGCLRTTAPVADAAAAGKQSERLSTGITMAYLEAGNRNGEVAVLLHGYTDSSRSFITTVPHLVRKRPDLHLFVLDLRGHGGSTLPSPDRCRQAPERCFRMEDLAADVLAFMDAKGIERAHLVGHSLGSFVAQEIALERPDRVRRLALIASGSRMKESPVLLGYVLPALIEPWKTALTAKGYASPEETYALTPLDADPKAGELLAKSWVFDPVADPALIAAITPETSRVPLGTWVGVARVLLSVDNGERLKGLSVPTLVIWATQDNVFLESPDQQSLRASLDAASARCRMSWFWKQYGRKPLPASGNQDDDLGHNTQWGAPEAVAADLAAFLKDGGEPVKDLPYADPGNVRRVLTSAAEARIIEGRARNCPP